MVAGGAEEGPRGAERRVPLWPDPYRRLEQDQPGFGSPAGEEFTALVGPLDLLRRRLADEYGPVADTDTDTDTDTDQLFGHGLVPRRQDE
jgi:hypothetical protein